MSFFLSFIFIILLCVIPQTLNQGEEASANEPIILGAPGSPTIPPPEVSKIATDSADLTARLGISSCSYYGIQKECNSSVVGVDKLPTECTSFVYDGLTVNDKYEISDSNGGEVEKYLKDFVPLYKPVILFYGYNSSENWYKKIKSNLEDGGSTAKEEMKSVLAYFTKVDKISGLIIKNVYSYTDGTSNLFTVNFQVYLEFMRSAFWDLAIGLHLIGTLILDNCSNPKKCFNFDLLDSVINFYVVDITNFNDCTDAFKCGTYPSSGDGKYTLYKLIDMLEKMEIPKSKVYFFFRGRPSTPDKSKACYTTYSELCKNPEVASSWCWDTQRAYYNKGKYMKANGTGFIIQHIDLIDPVSDCKCDRPFPSFYFTLDGFKGGPIAAPCPLFDGSCAK